MREWCYRGKRSGLGVAAASRTHGVDPTVLRSALLLLLSVRSMADLDSACELMPLSAAGAATATVAAASTGAVAVPAAAHPPVGAASSSLPASYASYLRQLVSACPDLPRVELRYTDLAYTLQLPLKQHAVATLASALPLRVQAAVQRARGGGVAHTLRMEAISACSGTIPPGSMTLILAPPGHGKSAFLKVGAPRSGSTQAPRRTGFPDSTGAHHSQCDWSALCAVFLYACVHV